MTNDDAPPTHDGERNSSEHNWLALAVAGGIILVVISCFVASWIFSAGEDSDRLTRVQIVAPFGVLAVAAITFATIVWRGLISARQADTGLQQLDGLRQQIALTEESGLANLLQKGAELLADAQPAKVSAGIASLQAVAASHKRLFREPALRLLADYVGDKGENSHQNNLVRQAISALNANAGRLDKSLYFEEDFELVIHDDYATDWRLVHGMDEVVYRNGTLQGQIFSVRDGGSMSFQRVSFYESLLDEMPDYTFVNCRFVRCRIGRVNTTDLQNNEYKECDFSSATIQFDGEMSSLREGLNYFSTATPPTAEGNPSPIENWLEYFVTEDEMLFAVATRKNPWDRLTG